MFRNTRSNARETLNEPRRSPPYTALCGLAGVTAVAAIAPIAMTAHAVPSRQTIVSSTNASITPAASAGRVGVAHAHHNRTVRGIVTPLAGPHLAVTDGWVAVLQDTTQAAHRGHHATTQHTLTLVSPTGVHHAIAHVADGWTLSGISANGRRVLLENTGQRSYRFAVYDTTTHATTMFAARAGLAARLTKPAGDRILLSDPAGQDGPLAVELDGTPVRTHNALAHDNLGDDSTTVSTPDGRLLIGTHGAGLAVVDAATGKLLHTLATPRGYSACFVGTMWDAGHVSGSCWNSTSVIVSGFTWSVTGGAATLRAQGQDTPRVAIYFANPRPTVAGTIAWYGTGKDSPDYGIVLIAPDKRHYRYVPAGEPNSFPLAVLSTTIVYTSTVDGRSILHSYDLRTHHTRVLSTTAGAGQATYAVVDSRA